MSKEIDFKMIGCNHIATVKYQSHWGVYAGKNVAYPDICFSSDLKKEVDFFVKVLVTLANNGNRDVPLTPEYMQDQLITKQIDGSYLVQSYRRNMIYSCKAGDDPIHVFKEINKRIMP